MSRGVEQNAAMFKPWVVMNQRFVDYKLQLTATHVSATLHDKCHVQTSVVTPQRGW